MLNVNLLIYFITRQLFFGERIRGVKQWQASNLVAWTDQYKNTTTEATLSYLAFSWLCKIVKIRQLRLAAKVDGCVSKWHNEILMGIMGVLRTDDKKGRRQTEPETRSWVEQERHRPPTDRQTMRRGNEVARYRIGSCYAYGLPAVQGRWALTVWRWPWQRPSDVVKRGHELCE